MKIYNTQIAGLKVIKGTNHYDNRGFFRETFKNSLFKKQPNLFLGYIIILIISNLANES